MQMLSIFGAVFEQVVKLMIFVCVGYLLSKTKVVDFKHSKILSCLMVYLFLPAHIFHTFSEKFTVKYISENYFIILASAVMLILLIVASFFVSKLLSKDRYQRKIYAYSLIIPNFGYMGYVLADALAKSNIKGISENLSINVMVFTFPLLIYTHTYGFCSLTNKKLNFRSLMNPPLIGMVLGAIVGLTGVYSNAFVADHMDPIITTASACMGPISMLLTGIVISEFNFKEILSNWKNYMVVALRLLIIPLAFAYALKFGADVSGFAPLKDVIMPALIIYASSCGLNTIVFPRLVGEDCKTGASLALISNIFVCITLPLCVALFI